MTTRRDFLKKTSYVAPVVLTLSASPSFGGAGSVRSKKKAKKKTKKKATKKPTKKVTKKS